jgi:hypothetical protein
MSPCAFLSNSTLVKITAVRQYIEGPNVMRATHAPAKAQFRWSRWQKNQWVGVFAIVACLILTACAPSQSSTVLNGPPQPTPTPIGQLPHPNPGGLDQPTNTPPPDLTGHPLPGFSDWRVAYIGMDGRLHAVSVNGKADVAGQGLPIQAMNELGIWAAGTSPDGRHLAYFSGTFLTIADVASGTERTYHIVIGDSTVSWSPDQRYLALESLGYTYSVSVADGALVVEPTTNGAPVNGPREFGGPFGWLDTTHVAVSPVPGTSATTTTLQSLDVTSGAIHTIATIPGNSGGNGFSVEPGGRYTLYAFVGIHNSSPSPKVDLINNVTGIVVGLPHIAAALNAGGGLTQILWRPGYSQLIAATGFPENGDLKYFLADVANDTATPLNLPGFPEAWSPDGGTLVIATGGQESDAHALGYQNIGIVGSGPYTLSAVYMNAQGGTSAPVALTSQAMDVPVLGFVRTA